MGKTIIITGASDGIGRAAAQALSGAGHTIVVVGRSPDKTKAVADEVGGRYHVADFARLDDVRRLAAELLERYPVVDVLCNNAGGIMGPRRTTVDGHEMTFQVNHLAPFLLTQTLLPCLAASRATVIATSSSVNRRGRIRLDDVDGQRKYSATGAYSAAKLANILFTKELHRRYADAGVAAASFEPGPVASNFGAESTLLMRLVYHSFVHRFLLSPSQGADTLVWLAGSEPGVDWAPGQHYGKRKPVKVNRSADDAVLGKRLWEQTEQMAQ
ncbi:SDR family NAD(P)-dependent oxidoreductase [Mycobacterium sp. 21AC1]|uniref:SDR family NAD(P)-dependent oxidoreductase n=1 Tax=[Mycobacterium] appelbergii TaxID=2939269 RepID=UPI002939256A|nr:SDR family NAD(P)-dependent oxidoreductase [Mycobacterium sp. 21AC1]MDV3124500.1 SDR family NAD(P)-dependent oxidoreductase [Mycobacterium sp. 21AC1]